MNRKDSDVEGKEVKSATAAAAAAGSERGYSEEFKGKYFHCNRMKIGGETLLAGPEITSKQL